MWEPKFVQWVKAASIRAVKTAAESAIGAVGGATMFGQVDWKVVAGTVVLSTIMSFLVSIRGLPELEVKDKSKEDK